MLDPRGRKREKNLKMNLIQFLPTNGLEIRRSKNIRRVAELGSLVNNFFPFKKKTTLLRYNSQAIKCTRLKCPVQ